MFPLFSYTPRFYTLYTPLQGRPQADALDARASTFRQRQKMGRRKKMRPWGKGKIFVKVFFFCLCRIWQHW